MTNLPHIAITTGEPAGIGPDISLALAKLCFDSVITIIGDFDVLQARAQTLNLDIVLNRYQTDNLYQHKTEKNKQHLSILSVAAKVPVQAGVADPNNADYVLEQLNIAIKGCLNGEFDAMVTNPINKAIINQAGIAFTGHTEYLGSKSNANPVMLLCTDRLRVALATTHLPLHQVPSAITVENITQTLITVNQGLQKYCGIDKPRIGVCGLNPHAGEQGYLGDEEQKIILPVIQKLQNQGLCLSSPLSADTAFTKEKLSMFDVIVAMYHDQGLPIIKHTGFGEVVNITLGLPFLRTSVDHGTALELAATGKASCSSLVAAINWAQTGFAEAKKIR